MYNFINVGDSVKKICMLVFCVSMIFALIGGVYAAGFVPDGGPKGDNKVSGSSTLPNRYDTIAYSDGTKSYLRGIRLSFVSADGVDLFVEDYINDSQLSVGEGKSFSFMRFNYYASSKKCSKVAYANGCTVGSWTKHSASQMKSSIFKPVSTLTSIFSKYGFSTGDVNGAIAANKFDVFSFVSNVWFKNTPTSYKNDDYENDLKSLIEHFIGSEQADYYFKDDNISKLFLVIEPVTVVTLKNEPYYGTGYELANLAHNTTGVYTTETGYEYRDGTTALNANLHSLLKYNVPCSSVVDGSILKTMKDKGILLPSFSLSSIEKDKDGKEIINGTYFNNIVLKSNACESGSELTPGQVTGNYGVGMGVVWFYEFFDHKEEPTCPIVHNLTGSGTYNSSKLLSCDDVKIKNIVSTFNDLTKKSDFKYAPISEEWYKRKCGCTVPEGKYNCSPTGALGKCDGAQTYYNEPSDDDEYWDNCVYADKGYYEKSVHKLSSSGAYTYLDQSIVTDDAIQSNDYCSIYCTESLKTNFQTSMGVQNAGTHFTWPNVSSIVGSRTCKMKMTATQWSTYQTTVKDNVADTMTYYNQYKKNSAILDILDDYDEISTESCGCEGTEYEPTLTCYVYDEPTEEDLDGGTIDLSSYPQCDVDGTSVTHPNRYSSYYSSYKSNGSGTNSFTATIKIVPAPEEDKKEDDTTTEVEGEQPETEPEAEPEKPKKTSIKISGTKYSFYLYKCTNYREKYVYKGTGTPSKTYEYISGTSAQNIEGSFEMKTASAKVDKKEMCELEYNREKSSASSAATKAEQNYKIAQSNANGAIKKMQKCYEWAKDTDTNRSKVYTSGAEVYLDVIDTGYTIPNEYKKLISTVNTDISKTFFNSNIDCDDNEDYYYSCNDSGCSKITESVDYCVPKVDDPSSRVTVTYQVQTDYRLNSSLFNYVRKDNNQSVFNVPDVSYVQIDYGNIPIAYGIADGTHEISLKYYNLGHLGASNSDSSYVDAYLKTTMTGSIDRINEEYGKWKCQYTSESKLIVESSGSKHSGINVIYRPIDLKNPFPNITGGGRTVGSNWCSTTSCSGNNTLVQSVIKTDVMSQTPMYVFELTPSVIRQIRKYNDSHVYSDFNLTCETETGKACVSDFITNLAGGSLNGSSYSIKATGACFQDNKRLGNTTDFYSCEN